MLAILAELPKELAIVLANLLCVNTPWAISAMLAELP